MVLRMESRETLIEYFNSLVKGLKKALYEQRGEGARFRTYLVGRDFFAGKIRELVKDTDDWNTILEKIGKYLKDLGLVTDLSYNVGPVSEFEGLIVGRAVKVNVKGCIHRRIDEELMEKKVPPYTLCPVANILIYIADEVKNKGVPASELILAEMGKEGCELTVTIFEELPTLKESTQQKEQGK